MHLPIHQERGNVGIVGQVMLLLQRSPSGYDCPGTNLDLRLAGAVVLAIALPSGPLAFSPGSQALLLCGVFLSNHDPYRTPGLYPLTRGDHCEQAGYRSRATGVMRMLRKPCKLVKPPVGVCSVFQSMWRHCLGIPSCSVWNIGTGPRLVFVNLLKSIFLRVELLTLCYYTKNGQSGHRCVWSQ